MSEKSFNPNDAKQIKAGELLTYEQAAEFLDVGYWSIIYYIKRGQLEKRETRYGIYVTKQSIEALALMKLNKTKRGRKPSKEKRLSTN